MESFDSKYDQLLTDIHFMLYFSRVFFALNDVQHEPVQCKIADLNTLRLANENVLIKLL